MKNYLFLTILLGVLCMPSAFSQTTEELEAQKAEKSAKATALKAEFDALTAEIEGINAKLVVWPRWEVGAFGTFGLGFNGFNNWISRDQPNISTSTIGIGANAYANRLAKKYFWRNGANINMGWQKFDNRDDPADEPKYQNSADAINFTSLFGYKFTEKLAASALAEYRSNIISNFNNPGYLDLGVGATWTPIENLVVVVHPLNYNFIFSENSLDYESSLGAKIVVDYRKELIKGINWKTNLSTFQSYKGADLSNWTWINSFGINVFNGLGIGLELGLRKNKQEAVAGGLTDNPLQSYYVLGLSYAVSAKK